MNRCRSIVILVALVLAAALAIGVWRQVRNRAMGESGPMAKPVPVQLIVASYAYYFAPEVFENYAAWSKNTAVVQPYQRAEDLIAMLHAPGAQVPDVLVLNSEWVPGLAAEGLLQPVADDGSAWRSDFQPEVLNRPDDPDDRYTRPYFSYRLGVLTRDASLFPAGRITSIADLERLPSHLIADDPFLVMAGIATLLDGPRPSTPVPWGQPHADALAKVFANPTCQGRKGSSDAATQVLDKQIQAALVSSGDAARRMGWDPSLLFVPLGQGDVVRVDVLAIPLRAPHPVEARRLIKAMGAPLMAMMNFNYVQYQSPSTNPQCLMGMLPAVRRQVVWRRNDQTVFVGDRMQPRLALISAWNALPHGR